MRALLQGGAVPDTWAPNGSSALMLAASVDGVEGLRVLLEAGASIELQVCACYVYIYIYMYMLCASAAVL
jgi:hypothetical protein